MPRTPEDVQRTHVSPAEPVPAEFDLLCEGCGYSLVGLMSDRCPECGQAFEGNQLPLARIPWLYRKRLGRIRSYCRTLWLILARPKVFATEMCRPVRICITDARDFRRLSIRILMVTAVLAGIVEGLFAIDWKSAAIPTNFSLASVWAQASRREIVEVSAVTLMSILAIPLVYLALLMMTDLPTFIWRGLENDPIKLAPLHYYASAPLGLMPFIAPLALSSIHILVQFNFPYEAVCVCAISLATLGILFPLWWIPQRLMKHATHCGTRQIVLLALYLPVHWIVMLVFCGLLWLVGAAILEELASAFR